MQRSIPALALAAFAASAMAAEPKVILPDWVRKPTADEIWWAYPPEAMRKGIEGSAQISCTVDENGDPQLCVILSETPPGMGFGQAAVSLRTSMKFRPKTVDGKYAPDDVQIPIRFTADLMATPTSPPASLTPRQVQLTARIVAALKLEESSARSLEDGLQSTLYFTAAFDAEDRRIIAEAVRGGIAKARPKLAEAVARDLVIGLSDEELERAMAFFETEGGKKIARRLLHNDFDERPALHALVQDVIRDARDIICRRSESVCRRLDLQALRIPERK